jgi:hypothetical protein
MVQSLSLLLKWSLFPDGSDTQTMVALRLKSGRMSFEEIIEELPKLRADEKERLRRLLDSELSWTEAEEQTIDEGIRSREEGPSVSWEKLDGRLRDNDSGHERLGHERESY